MAAISSNLSRRHCGPEPELPARVLAEYMHERGKGGGRSDSLESRIIADSNHAI